MSEAWACESSVIGKPKWAFGMSWSYLIVNSLIRESGIFSLKYSVWVNISQANAYRYACRGPKIWGYILHFDFSENLKENSNTFCVILKINTVPNNVPYFRTFVFMFLFLMALSGITSTVYYANKTRTEVEKSFIWRPNYVNSELY